jgi:hypothetical protein
LNEDWIKYRMVRSHHLLSLVLVAVGVGWSPSVPVAGYNKGNEKRLSNWVVIF